MSGPSWLIGKGIKEGLKAMGVDPLSATVCARGIHVASSLVFHDHHTHFHPYGDELSDAHDAASDHFDNVESLPRSGATTQQLAQAGYSTGDEVNITHADWKANHKGVIEEFRYKDTDITEVKIKVDKAGHNHEWVTSDHISKT